MWPGCLDRTALERDAPRYGLVTMAITSHGLATPDPRFRSRRCLFHRFHGGGDIHGAVMSAEPVTLSDNGNIAALIRKNCGKLAIGLRRQTRGVSSRPGAWPS